MCCVVPEAPETDRPAVEGPCSWSSIVNALRRKLPDVPTERQNDFEGFIELIEGIAALSER